MGDLKHRADAGAPRPEITLDMIGAGADTLEGCLVQDETRGYSSHSERCEVAEMVLDAALRKIDPEKLREFLDRLKE